MDENISAREETEGEGDRGSNGQESREKSHQMGLQAFRLTFALQTISLRSMQPHW